MKKTLRPAWTSRGRPPAGYWTKRTAEAWLRRTLAEAAAGTLAGMVRTGAAVADACAEYLRYIEQDRQRKRSTLCDHDSIFRNQVLPNLGDVRLEGLTLDRVERWAAYEIGPNRRLANRRREKTITVLHGVMERAPRMYRLPANPASDAVLLQRHRVRSTRRFGRGGKDEYWRFRDPAVTFDPHAPYFEVHPGLKETEGERR